VNIVEKLLAGTGILVGIDLILTNPNGTKAAANSISGAYVSGVKATQGR
jgi:hypothetical protein